jgi:hypothetical protein
VVTKLADLNVEDDAEDDEKKLLHRQLAQPWIKVSSEVTIALS